MNVPRTRLVSVDRILAGVLTVWLFAETWATGSAQGHRIAVSLLWPAITVAVAVRRRYPTMVGVLAASIAIVAQSVWPSQVTAAAIGWMCDLYAITVWTGTRRFAAFVCFYLAASGASIALNPSGFRSTVFFTVVSAIVMLLVRIVVGGRERRVRLAERERDVAAREAVVEERARIARELHDVIAHHVSMIVLQAGAERHALDGRESSARDVLGTIERTGRDALAETRRLLGMLREGGADPLSPQPGLADLDLLVSQVRDAGLPVQLHVEGDRRDLPVGLDLSAYRIVQEALTNALKHAGRATAAVRIRYHDDALELQIADDGASTPTRATGGHGLVGMRERVALYGGTFEARPRDGGGYLVRALLPIR
jgi:signal transduction histidine kinase